MARSRSMTTKKQRTAPEVRDEVRLPDDESAPVASLENERLTGRLAEMVCALSECDSVLATDAVRSILATGTELDALEVVAMALIAVEARQRGQLRVPAYVRPDEAKSISSRRALRRSRPVPPPAIERRPEPDAVVLDLRGGTAQVHLDLTGLEQA